MTTTAVQAEAIAQVRASFTDRIAKLKAELASCPHQNTYVFCWDKYALGVKLNPATGNPVTVGVEDAMIVRRDDRRTFYNGSREKARLIPRHWALQMALKTIGASYAHLEEALAKSQA